ncbi:hypothetical protein TRV_07922 [Trichophyton verrucosum HKI 0517]|uniref:Cell cycle control protein Cwf14/Bud31 n=1 Tax=Trichophyton verrucosum (strain HKI 0517) TaxID=663202 RepID=D4DL48_TRIVH|nr:uncharacterized protein TRV_07922 [Trichophyton verrucosum HKI 0517]EFE37441.1 hypothetical protein TRV_07922 [Trichophyton verrucosum HKI 0517]
MPPIRSARTRKAPPDGFDDIEDTLLEFSNKMKDAENASHEGKKRHEVLWPIFQISHQRSRYIYDLYYEKEAISKKLYDWLLKNGYADANLIAKWKKQGYEKLCCLRCIQTKETNFNATCICRVPKAQLKEDQGIQCMQGIACVTALFIFLFFRWSGSGVPLFGFQAMMMEFFYCMCVSAWALYCWFEFVSLAIGFSIFVFLRVAALGDEYCIDTHQIQNMLYMNITLIRLSTIKE